MVNPRQASVRVGPFSFDRTSYDVRADVLYLHLGDPANAVSFDSSEEGHALRYDAAGRLVGLAIVNARWLIERDGEVIVTPPALHVGAAELGPALSGVG